MNQLNLVGRLTKQPKVFGNDDNKVCVFTLAVKRDYPNQQTGEYEADFIQLKAFKKLGENCSKFLQKGSLVSVVGHISTGSFDKDGKKVYTSENIADNVRFLGGIKGSNDDSNNNRSDSNQNGNQNNNNIDEDPFPGHVNYEPSGDDDWPF